MDTLWDVAKVRRSLEQLTVLEGGRGPTSRSSSQSLTKGTLTADLS